MTQPVGAWAPIYAERLHHIAHLAVLDYDNPGPGERAWFAPFGEPEATTADVEELTIPGPHGPIPVRVYRPAAGDASGTGLVWYHGGAFLAGDLDMPEADLVARGLVSRASGVVVSVAYRLCRDGIHHPQPHDDAFAAYLWTLENAQRLGIEPSRLAVGGASAGGCLAGTVGLHARDAGVPPARLLLAYPVAHAEMPPGSPEYRAMLADLPPALGFPPETTRELNENYIGSDPLLADGYAFPGHAADLTGYPPTYIENCEFDELRASGEEFGRQLAAAGCEVEMATAAGVPHGHLDAIGSPLTAATLDRFAARMP